MSRLLALVENLFSEGYPENISTSLKIKKKISTYINNKY